MFFIQIIMNIFDNIHIGFSKNTDILAMFYSCRRYQKIRNTIQWKTFETKLSKDGH